MPKYIFLLIVLLPALTIAQTIPSENAKLNYRIAGFSVPRSFKSKYTKLEVAQGHFVDEKDFRNNIIVTQTDTGTMHLAKLPFWDKEYTWRMSFINNSRKKKVKNKTQLYHFATGNFTAIDTTKYRLRVIDSAQLHKDMLVILDYSAVMYDMKGNPVWYLPEVKGVTDKGMHFRDLKPTGTGTFTALCESGVFEFDYEGNIVWKGPDNGKANGDTTERYHHEFTKMPNGHYMALGAEYITVKIPDTINMSSVRITDTVAVRKRIHPKVLSGTVIEYDRDKNVVWKWKASDHFTEKQYFYTQRRGGAYELNTHLNAFYFDETKNNIYLSFKNIHSIVKIKYPSGEILDIYNPENSKRRTGEPFFLGQHAPRLSTDGSLLLYNNNFSTSRESLKSSVQRYGEEKGRLKLFWQFQCDIDTNAKPAGMTGGNVLELPDKTLLVCMGSAGRVFLVSGDKKVLWNAVPEYKPNGKDWVVYSQYRASYIDSVDVRRLIFK